MQRSYTYECIVNDYYFKFIVGYEPTFMMGVCSSVCLDHVALSGCSTFQ